MQLRPLKSSDIQLVSEWMGDKENYKWLDFGAGHQILSAASLAVMSKRPLHCLRLFVPSGGDAAAGLVALSNVTTEFKSATLWYVLGDKSHSGRGYTSKAVGKMLRIAFSEIELQTVNAWAIEQNKASIEVLLNNGFRLIGRQRRCQMIDGELVDRLWFDILTTEFQV